MNLSPLCVALLAVAALAACAEKPSKAAGMIPVARPVLALKTGTPVRIPRATLVERGGIPGVFVLDTGVEPPQARFRMVRAGHPNDGQIEILSGLKGGEVLVTGDLAPVRDGTAIKVKPLRTNSEG
jgi:hypothetical protein